MNQHICMDCNEVVWPDRHGRCPQCGSEAIDRIRDQGQSGAEIKEIHTLGKLYAES